MRISDWSSDVCSSDLIILKTQASGATVRLADVAKVELGAQSYNVLSRIDGHPGAGLAVSLAPGADALTTAEIVKHAITERAKSFPAGFELDRKSVVSGKSVSVSVDLGGRRIIKKKKHNIEQIP